MSNVESLLNTFLPRDIDEEERSRSEDYRNMTVTLSLFHHFQLQTLADWADMSKSAFASTLLTEAVQDAVEFARANQVVSDLEQDNVLQAFAMWEEADAKKRGKD